MKVMIGIKYLIPIRKKINFVLEMWFNFFYKNLSVKFT